MSGIQAQGLESFLEKVKNEEPDTSIELLRSLLKRRQIRHSRPCAIATAHLLQWVIETYKAPDIASLINRVQEVGQRLTSAQPRELAVGNIIRRIIGVIRIEAEEDREGQLGGQSQCGTGSPQQQPEETKENLESRSVPISIQVPQEDRAIASDKAQRAVPVSQSVYTTASPAPATQSLFNLLSHPHSEASSPTSTPGTRSPYHASTSAQATASSHIVNDFRAEITEAIDEIIEEISQADDQIAGYATDHIHSNETILTHTASITVQKFLLKAARHRRFTVIQVESYPNNHDSVHAAAVGRLKDDAKANTGSQAFRKTLTAAGITVILVPDSAVFAIMSRVNKVILATHAVLANGGLVAAAGAKIISKTATVHRVPVIVLSGVYKLSPQYPFDLDALIEYGDGSKMLESEHDEIQIPIVVHNPLYDYVSPDLVDLYITNLGGHAPSYLYRVILDSYGEEDVHII